MSAPISVVSSKATQVLLTELTQAFEARSGKGVALQSVGGVTAAERVREGEPFDVVILAQDAIRGLMSAGHLTPGSSVDLVRSGVGAAVRQGADHPDISTPEALRKAVLAAKTIGHSTGPSGVKLVELFDDWGIADELRARLVVAPPGVPVASLVACGEVELGFQQLSELLHVDGIDVVGALPDAIQIVTTFSAAVGAASDQPEAARELIAFLASPATEDVKRREGMEPAVART